MLDPKPKVRLVGEDGNAFAILGRCRKALRQAGASKEEINQFTDEAESGDYDHLLQTVMKWFEHDSGEDTGFGIEIEEEEEEQT